MLSSGSVLNTFRLRMQQLVLLALLGASLTLAQSDGRESKSLANTFPFNRPNQHGDHHGDQHGDHHGDQHGGQHGGHHGNHAARDSLSSDLSVLGRNDRQRQRQELTIGYSTPNPHSEVATARPGYDGKRCIDKVEMVEVIEYEDHIQCDHSYDERCHTTYVTNYESQQEEECEETFRKSCFIDYDKIAWNETVEVCRIPIEKPEYCEVAGPEICRTEYESECWTKPEKHEVVDDVVSCTTEYDEICGPVTSGYTTKQECSKWPRESCTVSKEKKEKVTPVTGCHKVPITLCAPAGCKPVPKPEHCHHETKTIVQDKPREECSLEPQRTCKHVTKLVPKLSPTEECVDVPKEVCTRSRVPKPDPIKKPVIKKWCYVPSDDSPTKVFN